MGPIQHLVTDRDLLDPGFDGYKLSLSPIPVYKREIGGVDVVEPNDDQYSFLHQKEFILHNHLYGDISNPGVVFYVNPAKKIVRCSMNEELLDLEGCEEVWEVTSRCRRQPGDFNVSLQFPSAELAIVSDGIDTLFILETQSRKSSTKWKVLHREKVLLDGRRGFKTVDCRCDGAVGERSVVCVLRGVLPVRAADEGTGVIPDASGSSSSKFQTVLYFVTFYEDVSGIWKKDEIKELRGPGSVEYSAVEPGGRAVYVAGDINFEFLTNDAANGETTEMEPKYSWQQNFEDIRIWFDLPEGTTRSDVGVKSTDTEITITCRGDVLLDGRLVNSVRSELTTWTLDGTRLEIVIEKAVDGGMWRGLIAGEDRSSGGGREVVDESLVGEIHDKLSHLCSEKQENGEGSTPLVNSSQLEECDAFESESRILARIDVRTLHATHKIMVGGQQWLFNLTLGADKAPAFCVRNDVDGCVWQPEPPPTSDSTDWPCSHVGTFLAFGYVQASKTQKKFTLAPPDMSYVAIVDTTGHVIVYRRGIEVTGALRNRKTGRRISSVACQQMVNLQTGQGAVMLGAFATQCFIFVLTSEKIYVLHVANEENTNDTQL